MILAGSLATVLCAGARADEPTDAESHRMVDRSLLLPKKSFGVDASIRGADGFDGAMFEYLVSRLEVGTGSGVTEIKFGMDFLVSQPQSADELDLLEKVYVQLGTEVGTGGVVSMGFQSFYPTMDEAIKPQVVDLSVLFKRAVHDDIAILAGGGFDFAYLLFPDGMDPGESFWVTRFHLTAGGMLQLTPSVAAEATGSVFIPIAQNPNEEEGGYGSGTTLGVRGRGYYTLSSTIDVYVELSFNSEDDLLASLGETKTATLGIRGRL